MINERKIEKKLNLYINSKEKKGNNYYMNIVKFLIARPLTYICDESKLYVNVTTN